MAQRGHRVFTIAPRYDQYADGWDTTVSLNIDGETGEQLALALAGPGAHAGLLGKTDCLLFSKA